MDVEVDVRKPQPPCPFSRSFHRILCRRSRKQLVRSLSRGMAGRGAQAAGIPGRLWADTRAAVARDGAGRGRPAGDGSEAGGQGARRAGHGGGGHGGGVRHAGDLPVPGAVRAEPALGRGRPSAAGEAISGRGEWKAGWRLARFVWPGALLTFSAVGLDFSVHFHSTGAEEAGPGAGRGCCARMEICKDEEEVRACIREGRKFHLDPSVTELELRSVSRWSSLLILCSSSHRVHLGMVFDIFSERHRCGLGPAHRRCAGEQLVADAVGPRMCASLSLHSRSHWRRCSSHHLLFQGTTSVTQGSSTSPMRC